MFFSDAWKKTRGERTRTKVKLMKTRLTKLIFVAALIVGVLGVSGIAWATVTINATTVSSNGALTLRGATASTWSTTTQDLTLSADAASVNINANEAAANQIDLTASGTTTGNAININTVNGGIILTAADTTNGDITINPASVLILGDLTTGDGVATVAVYSSDWEISTAGVMTGIDSITIETAATGLTFAGTYTDSAIDLSDVTLNYSGAGGPVMIRAGTYANPVTSSDAGQSGMIRLYGSNSATTDDESSGFYDRGLFVNLQVTGNKGAFPIAGLVEVRDVGGEAGPIDIRAADFVVGLHTATAKFATGGWGMFGSWSKVYSVTDSVAASGTIVAPVWVDNQMSGTVSGEEYGIFATTGGTQPDGFIGFQTTSSGWDSLFYFDETMAAYEPLVDGDAPGGATGASDKYLRVNINGTMYGIPLYTQ